MKIIALKNRPNISNDIKLNKIYSQFEDLLKELEKKVLTQNIITFINDCIEQINSSSLEGQELRKLVKQKQTTILKKLEKELKIVPKNYYRNLWIILGMSAFGIPFGMAFGLSIGNLGFLGLGMPIGMAIGAAIGSKMDKKALEEGRQLGLEVKY